MTTSSHHLNPHDLLVLSHLDTLEQASSHQLQRLCFSQPELSPRSYGVRTRSKLLRLYQQGHLRRFASIGTGGWVYLPGYSRATRIDHHTLDVAEVYVRLVEAGIGIREWTPRDRIGSRTEDDAYCWLGNGTDWHLEIDRGSERRPQLRDKMRAYQRAFNNASDNFPQVLYIVTFNPRGSLAERVAFIQSVINQQPDGDLFQVCTLGEAVDKLN